MLGLVWEVLGAGKDAVVGRLTAHKRNADNLRQLQEKVWELEALLRASDLGHTDARAEGLSLRRIH